MKIDIGTAGSITLLLQSLLLPCIFSNGDYKLHLFGGTDVKWSQPIDYFSNILLPHLRKYADIAFEIIKRGYYPKGNGEIKISVSGGKGKNPISLLKQSELLQIKGVSHASLDLQEKEVNEKQTRNAEFALSDCGVPVNINQEYVHASSTGSGITLWGIFGDDEGINFQNPVILGGDSLGEPSIKPEIIGEEAALALKKEISSGAAADKYLADQLVPFLGINGGAIKTSKVTKHCLSNIYVAENFLDVKFDIKDNVISVN